ncbi:alcohol dehydrogenase catalytic domain-containing protein [Halomarina halobia]|uniref:Alcohol dehydrogenase catalytic domain-containing protein n=1 Tax=Halomarina halobia TaxID=3033386 RepID=A0ABD6AAL2_9EURY|nr:alcohol dehydrogenase catalytic domain-containing protein [Halomarina sp. PSR21]
MRAVVSNGPEEPMTVEEVDPPECDPDGVVVETEACGVCRSDWHAWKGDWSWIGLMMSPGLIFGHEPCGTVVEVGGEVSRPVDTMVTDEREFYGSYGMPPHEYEEIFSMMEAGRLDPGRIVSETIPLSAVPDTVASMGDYETVGTPVCDSF